MEDWGDFIEVEEIDDDINAAILEEQGKALAILKMSIEDEPSKIVGSIKQYIDSIFEDQSILNYNKQELKDIAITLGSAWGMAVCDAHNWKWQALRREDEEYPAYFVVSPSHKFCCPPFGFILNILEGENFGLDNRNDNTVMLLFNMIETVDFTQSAPHNYTVLM